MSEIRDVYRLTPVQEGMLAQDKLKKDGALYAVSALLCVSCDFPLTLLQQAVSLLSERHEVLKTAFIVLKSSGAAKQVVLDDREPEFFVKHFAGAFSQSEPEAEFDALSKRPFDLTRDPLARFTVLAYSDARFLLFHAHHIILDGWSLPVLMEDLNRYCGYLSDGQTEKEIRETIEKEKAQSEPFSAYVKNICSRSREEARKYWRTLFDENSNPSFFPQKVRTATPHPKQKEVSIPESLCRRIRDVARMERLTENTLFEGCFGLALQRFSGTDDVTFGKTISGRSGGGKILRTVGPFINTVPVRSVSLTEDTVTTYLRRTQERAVDADRFGILPYAELVNTCLGGTTPDVLFVFENYAVTTSDRQLTPLDARLLSFREKTEFGLHLTVYPKDGRYVARAVFEENRYPEKTVHRLLQSFLYLLEQTAESVQRPLSALWTLPQEELEQAAKADFREVPIPEKSVYALFSEQAKRNPDAIRITDRDRTYSFSDLKAAAEKTDCFIRSRIGNQKQVVGVLCDRGFSELAAIYGIVRGGSAYLPLSPEFPKARIKALLEQSGCKLVLTQEKYLSLTDRSVSVESLLEGPAPETGPAPAAAPDDLLYVIFTSGSTGTPKGAMVTNRSIVNRVGWMANRYFDPDTVVMRKTPYTFDVSVWEIFGFAMYGFSLYILPPGDHYRMGATLDAIEAGKVTDLHFVPTVFDSFLEYLHDVPARAEKLGTLKNVFLSGETLHAASVDAFSALAPEGVKLHNLYGPAECAVDVTFYDCARNETDPVPIGKPVDNTRIYVLDKDLRPVPVGVTGQICIAGMNVGQGYFGDPELTAQKFVTAPFGEGKLYLTGDLGYWREDGNLIFAGRNDFQIKLHGQRVELGEIESALTAIGGVFSAAVLLKHDPDRLTAFYTGTADEAFVSAELERVLPTYMRPSALLRMETMPRNASGKTDRKALDALTLSDAPEGQVRRPPETETEKEICIAFENCLGVPEVGRLDGFYELGGTSLQLISLLSRPPLDKLTPEDFLSDPTPAGLAKRLDGERIIDYTYLVPLYQPGNAERALLLFSFAGGDAAAFTALTAVYKKKQSHTALFYVPWLSDEAYPAAADEIRSLAAVLPTAFYSHCAGAVTAMRLLDLLNRDLPVVTSWTAGGNVPPKPGKTAVNIWKNVPDSGILRFLRHAGLSDDVLPEPRCREMLLRFRRDTAQFFTFAKEKTDLTPIRVRLILSKTDPFTRNYRQAADRWRRYAEDVGDIRFITCDSHYFQTEKADELFMLLSDDEKEG